MEPLQYHPYSTLEESYISEESANDVFDVEKRLNKQITRQEIEDQRKMEIEDQRKMEIEEIRKEKENAI